MWSIIRVYKGNYSLDPKSGILIGSRMNAPSNVLSASTILQPSSSHLALIFSRKKFEVHLKHNSVSPTFTKIARPKLRNLNVRKLGIACATNYVINIKQTVCSHQCHKELFTSHVHFYYKMKDIKI